MKRMVFVVLLVAMMGSTVFAYDWIVNPANGHRYTLVSAGYDWNEAESNSVALGGHLVTINDADENEWVKTSFGEFDFMWIGLYEVDYNARTWAWISGEPVTFSNWAEGEPSGPGWEHWVAMMGPSFHDGQWADLTRTWEPSFGYKHIAVVEVIPEPSSLLALCGGVGGLLAFRRRRRK